MSGGVTSPDRGTVEEVLAARARTLALRAESAAATVARANAVLFRFGEETYALEAESVRGVLRPPPLTLVPGAPPVLLGMATLRGELLPVFDLAVVLGLEARASAAAERVLVLGLEVDEIAVPVEHLLGVASVPLESLYDAKLPARAAERGLLRGCTADAVTVIDGRRLLKDPALHIGAEDGDET